MTLATEKRCLLKVITEAAIEDAVLKDFDRLGVKGYTVSDARGRGTRGLRDGAYDGAANIRIEVICTRTLAEQLLLHVQATYYANYAMVAFLQEVEVLRPEK